MNDAAWLRSWLASWRHNFCRENVERLGAIADRLERPEAVTDEMVAAGVNALHDNIDLSDELLADLADDMPRVVSAIYKKMHRLSKVSPLIVGPK